MENFKLSLIVLIFFISACSNDDEAEYFTKDFKINQFPQEWRLAKSVNGFSGEVSEWKELSTTQVYKFNKNQTFLKKVVIDQETYIGKGIYDLKEDNQGRLWFYLTFSNSGGTVESCLPERDKEHLYFNEESKELQGGSHECDGPALYFKRVK